MTMQPDGVMIANGLRFYWTPWSLGISLVLLAVVAAVCLAGWWRSGFRAGYGLLGLLTFFTVGPNEARAWTVRAGAKAPEAAGAIHSDFERGFIAAETIAFADYVALGGEGGAKEAGKARTEGRDYTANDGDVFLFRFNV